MLRRDDVTLPFLTLGGQNWKRKKIGLKLFFLEIHRSRKIREIFRFTMNEENGGLNRILKCLIYNKIQTVFPVSDFKL